MTDKSGCHFLLSMLCKFICFMLLCTFQAKVTTCETIVCAIKTLSEAAISTPITIYKWFNKPGIQHTKKNLKTSNGSGKFSHNLRKSKKSCYNKRNCKTGRHGRRHTFMKRNSQTKRTTTNNTSQDLKIKGRKLGTFKSPLLKDLTICSEPSIVKKTTNILTIMKTTLYCITSLTCAMTIYPWNKTKQIGFPSAFPDIVSSDMFFWIPTHSMKWIHGWTWYGHPRNQGM